jgi:RimJ/RimL family protein N-acetyltransferase
MNINVNSMILNGNFAKLRPIEISDAQKTLKWRLSERAKFMQDGAQTLEQQEKWITNAKNKTNEITFIIEFNNISVGMFAICNINHTYRNCSIARLLIGEKEIVGKTPVAFESELLLCDFIFNDMNMHKINGDIMEDNKKVIKLRKYLGYSFDGVLRDQYIIDGKFKSTLIISMLKQEYISNCRPRLLGLIKLSKDLF